MNSNDKFYAYIIDLNRLQIFNVIISNFTAPNNAHNNNLFTRIQCYFLCV